MANRGSMAGYAGSKGRAARACLSGCGAPVAVARHPARLRDAALAALDLASVYNLQGRNSEVCRIAEETLAIFQTNNMHREAIAALSFLCSEARMEEVGSDLVRRISAFLKASRNNPELRFAVSS